MYIVLEGIDGSGKSTQADFLINWIGDLGLKAQKVVEPSSSDVGILIRKILKDEKATSEDYQRVLALLFAADRLILKDEINQKESEGNIIISDRSFISSLVYQNPQDWVADINKFIKKPDLVLLLDVDVKNALKRCDGEDTFEKESFLINVKKEYLKLSEEMDIDFIIIDTNNGINKIQSDIKKAVAPYISICKGSIP